LHVDSLRIEEFATRDILYVKGILERIDTVHVLVNHWPSQLGGKKSSDHRRESARKVLEKTVDSIRTTNADASIIVMGDFNTEEPDVHLHHPPTTFNEMGTIKYRGRWEKIDHFYTSGHLLDDAREKIFNAFARTPFDKVKVVIIGQDPYHEPGQAQGLAFYVPPTVKTPPSLRNISKELKEERLDHRASGLQGQLMLFSDQPIEIPASDQIPDLLDWTDQGVLLINATLTVEAGKAGSHQKRGWEEFTDAAIRRLSEKREHLVFLLWGAYAQKKGAVIDRTKHLVLESAHPSPLSARNGFFGNGHFRKTNDYLVAHGLTPINW